MAIRPAVVGLVLCELAIVDEKTRNVSAINCFSRRIIEGEIETTPHFYVFATMVGGHGTMPAKLVIERLEKLITRCAQYLQNDWRERLRNVS